MSDLLNTLATFFVPRQGAYPDLNVTTGISCVNIQWCSHTLTARVEPTIIGCNIILIAHDQSGQERNDDFGILPAVVDLIVEHIIETGYDDECGEAPKDAEPGTFAARVWVTLYQARIARLDPDGRYSVKQSEPLITLAKFTDDDTNF